MDEKDKTMKKVNYFTLIGFILSATLTGALSAFLTKEGMTIFEGLNKPMFSPPRILFPIAWTILYIMMGVAAYIVFQNESGSSIKSDGMFYYVLQLIINFFWAIIFFNLKEYVFAFIWLILLIVVVFNLAKSYRDVSTLSMWLTIPYLAWLGFAAYLNLGIVLLN